MKNFIILTFLAVVVTATGASRPNSQTDGSFVTAQRYCPNGRC
jgi:hypothetical protein